MPKYVDQFRPLIQYGNDSPIYTRTPRALESLQVIIIGCGGSGSWIGWGLALMGVNKMILVDDDILEVSNLNRTPYRIKDIGKLKISALSELIRERRTQNRIIPIPMKIESAENWEKIVSELHLQQKVAIIDCTDNYDTKRIISEAFSIRMRFGYTPFYLKVGYDGENYDIDGSNEYVFDSGFVGYRVISTTVATTFTIASKVISLLRLYYDGMLRSDKVRILGSLKAELNFDENTREVKTVQRTEEDEEIPLPETPESDFEFEVYDTDPVEHREEEVQPDGVIAEGEIGYIQMDAQGHPQEVPRFTVEYFEQVIAEGRYFTPEEMYVIGQSTSGTYPEHIIERWNVQRDIELDMERARQRDIELDMERARDQAIEDEERNRAEMEDQERAVEEALREMQERRDGALRRGGEI